MSNQAHSTEIERIATIGSDEFYSAYLYPSTKFDYGSKLSQVDIRNCDLEKFPLFAKAQVVTTVLDAGEILFIPRGWWHQTQILSPSISVNSFEVSLKGFFMDRVPEKIRSILHRYGLYGQDCTCHMTQGKPIEG